MTTTATRRTEELTGVAGLLLRNEHGDVTVRCTTATDGVARVHLTAHGSVDLSAATLRVEGDALVVDMSALRAEGGARGFSVQLGPISLSSGSTGVDIEVELPDESWIKARTKSGDINITGEAGAVAATCGSGEITIDQAHQVNLTTGSGSISLGTCRGGGMTTTGAGKISIGEVSGHDLSCRAGSGSISLRRTQVEKTTVATGSGSISAHLGAGELAAKSGSGSIDITVPQGIPVWLDLASGMGSISKDIDPVGAPEEGRPHLAVKAKSGVGSIRVHH